MKEVIFPARMFVIYSKLRANILTLNQLHSLMKQNRYIKKGAIITCAIREGFFGCMILCGTAITKSWVSGTHEAFE